MVQVYTDPPILRVQGMMVAVMGMSFPRLGARQFSLSSKDRDDAIKDDFDEHNWTEDSLASFKWQHMRGRTWALQTIASVQVHGISFHWQVSIAGAVDYHSDLTLLLNVPVVEVQMSTW
ncbi:hypothetical protein BDR06DRAFT_1053588 [Suillus hirtellus]|nr:hypothetical protein BDR06DRAFT_1053588 [Suillus hirtellus]